jgi:hypothetical protein
MTTNTQVSRALEELCRLQNCGSPKRQRGGSPADLESLESASVAESECVQELNDWRAALRRPKLAPQVKMLNCNHAKTEG